MRSAVRQARSIRVCFRQGAGAIGLAKVLDPLLFKGDPEDPRPYESWPPRAVPAKDLLSTTSEIRNMSCGERFDVQCIGIDEASRRC
jgi:hypothetical protein